MTRSWRRGKERDRDSDHREGRRKERWVMDGWMDEEHKWRDKRKEGVTVKGHRKLRGNSNKQRRGRTRVGVWDRDRKKIEIGRESEGGRVRRGEKRRGEEREGERREEREKRREKREERRERREMQRLHITERPPSAVLPIADAKQRLRERNTCKTKTKWPQIADSYALPAAACYAQLRITTHHRYPEDSHQAQDNDTVHTNYSLLRILDFTP